VSSILITSTAPQRVVSGVPWFPYEIGREPVQEHLFRSWLVGHLDLAEQMEHCCSRGICPRSQNSPVVISSSSRSAGSRVLKSDQSNHKSDKPSGVAGPNAPSLMAFLNVSCAPSAGQGNPAQNRARWDWSRSGNFSAETTVAVSFTRDGDTGTSTCPYISWSGLALRTFPKSRQPEKRP